MKYNPVIHNRRSIRKKGYDYSKAGLYFITICVQYKELLFGTIENGNMILNDAGKMIHNEWEKLPLRFNNIDLQEFTVMPNHFHGILEIVGAPLVGAQFDGAQIDDAQFNGDQNDISQTDSHNITVGAPLVGAQMDDAQIDDAQFNGDQNDIGQTDSHNITVGAPLVGAQMDDDRNGGNRNDAHYPIVGAPLVGAKNDDAQNDDDRNDDEISGQNIGADQSQDNQSQTRAPTRGAPTDYSVGQMIGVFKSITTVEYINGVNESDWLPFDGKLWQRNFYEHIIRNEEAYEKIADYILNNPSRWREDKFYRG